MLSRGFTRRLIVDHLLELKPSKEAWSHFIKINFPQVVSRFTPETISIGRQGKQTVLIAAFGGPILLKTKPTISLRACRLVFVIFTVKPMGMQ